MLRKVERVIAGLRGCNAVLVQLLDLLLRRYLPR